MKKAKFIVLQLIFILLFQLFLSSFSFAEDANLIADELVIPNTYSAACLLMELNTGKILYEKNINEVRFPASTTKIMTAILALEKCNLSDIVTVNRTAISAVPPSYERAYLQVGEKLTVEQLLNLLLIYSANDAANVLAEHISGTINEFANLMNSKAKEIGCLNTNFVNPTGVHNTSHTSTAYDLAIIGKYAMRNNTFREIVKKTSYTLPATNKYSKNDRIFKSTNDLLEKFNERDKYYYPNTIGIKTGFTDEAGSCIVAAAAKNDFELIVVILGGKSTEDGGNYRYIDCMSLFDYGFAYHENEKLNKKNNIFHDLFVWKNIEGENKFLAIVFRILLIIVILYLIYILLHSSKKDSNKK